jgi:heptosyltransferase-1
MTAVLLVRMSSLGDIVHTFPAVTDLKRERPGAALHWVVEEQYVELARMHPGVDRIIPVAIRRWRRFGTGAWAEAREARRRLGAEPYDAVVDSQGLLKSVLVARQARGPLHGFGWSTARDPLASLFYERKIDFVASTHKIARYRGLMAFANGYAAGHDIDYGLTPPPVPPWAPGRPYAVLLHSTARAAKLWDEPSWIAVAQALEARGIVCVLPFGSDDEAARARRIAASVASAMVAPRIGFVEAGGLLAHARAVIGLDTGFTHLAAAFGTPVVGVFCDSEPVDAHPVGSGPAAYCGAIGAPPTSAQVLAALARVAPLVASA